ACARAGLTASLPFRRCQIRRNAWPGKVGRTIDGRPSAAGAKLRYGLRCGLSFRMEHHPGYDVLPSKVKAVLMETARRLALVAGEPPPDDALYFVLNGALGFLPSGQRVCVGVIPPGSVLGWEAAVGATLHAHETRAVLPTEGYVAPLKPVHAVLRDAWIHQFLAAYAASRARALGVEAACNARHTALQRLAKWIARL